MTPLLQGCKILLVKTGSWVIALLFAFASVAWEGVACASLDGQPSCCVQCPFKLMPKVGHSCCDQGVDKGNIGIAIPKTPEKPVVATANLSGTLQNQISHLLEVTHSLASNVVPVYLFEKHLLL